MTAVPLSELPLLETDVLVVGAGPTGLMAALVLARRGVRAEVIDPKSGPTRESRALVVQARSMEIYDQLGLAQQVLEAANPATGFQLRQSANPEGFQFAPAQAGDTPFPGAEIFEQSRNEELLASALEGEGRPVRWGHRLVTLLEGIDPADEQVEALVEGPQGLCRLRARWCIGADGASSTVRHQLGLPFEGVTDDATFCVADLHGVTGIPDNTVAARFGDASFAVFIPLGPGGHARLVCLSPTESPDQDEVLAEARADLGINFERVDWFSAYRVHHRVASQFRKGRALLAGDAAHVHSPIGGQGMNAGLQDAHHLANLLADVVRGHLTPSAVGRYERERRPVALTLIEGTDRAFGIIARRGRGAAALRRRFSGIISLLGPTLFRSALGPRLGGLLGQYRIRYRQVPAGTTPPAWADDPAVGLRLLADGERADALRAMTWQLHTYGSRARRPAVPDWIEGPFAFAADPRGRLRPDRMYLIRPDGFVAAAFPLHAGAASTYDVSSALAAFEVVA
ncbi:FAD-dependent monooxygenase [Brachybacterium sp. GCM10030268]|uniref:FAD-dependent monooxygenase n=1 Tax=Brachybacterium sp. GCM10030268 TaxID=3273382 RepID=UPI003609B174